jgi:hypothetical protein
MTFHIPIHHTSHAPLHIGVQCNDEWSFSIPFYNVECFYWVFISYLEKTILHTLLHCNKLPFHIGYVEWFHTPIIDRSGYSAMIYILFKDKLKEGDRSRSVNEILAIWQTKNGV